MSPTVTIKTSGLLLTVDNPDGESVRLYDIMGHQLGSSRQPTFTIHLPASGIYLVKPGDRPAKKIVAIR